MVAKDNKIIFICSNHANLFFNFRFITHFLSFAGKMIAWEAAQAITSAIGTQPEKKNELHQQKVSEMMTISEKMLLKYI